MTHFVHIPLQHTAYWL